MESLRRASDERMLDLAAHRAALRQQIGSIAVAENPALAATQLQEALRTLNVEESELEKELLASEASLGAVALRLADAEEDARIARRDQSRADAELRRVSSDLTTSSDLQWLREALPTHAIPSPRDSPAQQAVAIGYAGGVVNRVEDRLGAHRSQLAAVENALRGLGRRLRGHALETQRYVEPLEKWLGEHFSEWFNIPRVRAELLPEADGPVRVDLKRAEVTWRKGSLERARPLEAFSSGEQAFAYTRARLAILDEEANGPANRLIVLDEFGAFIAHDLLAGLLAYLRRSIGRPPVRPGSSNPPTLPRLRCCGRGGHGRGRCSAVPPRRSGFRPRLRRPNLHIVTESVSLLPLAGNLQRETAERICRTRWWRSGQLRSATAPGTLIPTLRYPRNGSTLSPKVNAFEGN